MAGKHMAYRGPGKQSENDNVLVVPKASDYRDIMCTYKHGGFNPEFNDRRIELIMASVKKNMHLILVESNKYAAPDERAMRHKLALPVHRSECEHSSHVAMDCITYSYNRVINILRAEGDWQAKGHVWFANPSFGDKYRPWPFTDSAKINTGYCFILKPKEPT